jgi:hypothetical protein
MDKKTHEIVVFVIKAFLIIGVLSTALGLYGHNAFVAYAGVGLVSLSFILATIYGSFLPEIERYRKVQAAKNLKELTEITR